MKCENLEDADSVAEQLSFDDLVNARPVRSTDAVVDAARRKFGPEAVGYGTLLGNPGGLRFTERPVDRFADRSGGDVGDTAAHP